MINAKILDLAAKEIKDKDGDVHPPSEIGAGVS